MAEPAPKAKPGVSLVRSMGRWTLAALVLNSIIGSGVFGLPSLIAKELGSASPWAYLVAAAGVGVIMACFAEVASRYRQAGGPYLYAREAFGRFAGIQMGWLAWLVRITAAAANANLFVLYMAEFWPRADQPGPRFLILVLLLGVLATVNLRGVGTGAGLSNFFAVVKVVTLLLFIAAGGWFLFFAGGAPVVQAPVAAGSRQWLEAVLLLVYAYGGFEAALLPMSEARDPQRDAPFALFTALATCTVIYTLIQLVVLATLENAAGSTRPLADAARAFLGATGASLVAVAALFSVYGYLASAVLNAPRLTYAFAERGDFPSPFAAVHRRFRTPHVSILVFVVLVLALASQGSFRWNATLSAVARLFTYALVCGALITLRRKQAPAAAFRLPAGSVFSALGILFSAVLALRMGQTEMLILALTTVVALANWLWARRRTMPGDTLS